jgi:molybdenum-dependent DNA-binding transcriptional regulator ModE
MDKFAAMRVFVKIADAGNLSAAGRQLGLSLTSVSRQLMALEEVLGTTLVERTTRHLSLTESGLLYYERAKQILEEVAEAERGLTAPRGIASGRLHVSAPSLLGRLRLAPMLPGFLAEQTKVSIDLMLVDRCESAPKWDPFSSPGKHLISPIKFVRGGVPVGADWDPCWWRTFSVKSATILNQQGGSPLVLIHSPVQANWARIFFS